MMRQTRTILGSVLGLVALAGLAVGVGALIRVTAQPSTAAGPLQATALPGISTALVTEPSTPTIPPPTLPSPTPSPAEIPWADAEAILLFPSSDKLDWLPTGERLAEAAPAPLDLPIAPAERGETVEVGNLYPSPDGRYVAFFVLYTPPIEGTEGWWKMYAWSPYPDQPPREILSAAEFGLDFKFFGWRPNSREVICWSGMGEWHGIFLLDVETGKRTTVIQPKEWADLPYDPAVHGVAVSPDGKQMIVSFTLTGEGFEVWGANIDGTEPRQLFSSMAFVVAMSWSPDGKWVSFVRGGDVEVMSPDGQEQRTVGTGHIGGLAPVWSPDSRYLAFTAVNPTPSKPSHDVPPDSAFDFSSYTVRIADVLTGEEWDLAEDAVGGEIGARWSPDGKQLVFLSDRSGATEVWIADVDGANLRQATFDGQPKRTTPVWIPIP
jgi:WD40 repeat protein